MTSRWCAVCSTRHEPGVDCPGELQATGPERHGWRVNAETPLGIEAYGVLIAPSYDVWRARIMTYPNVLWSVPGQQTTIKFVGATPQEAERQAIDFVRAHCTGRGFVMRAEVSEALPGRIEVERTPSGIVRPSGAPAVRKIRFLPVRFGVVGATEPGGTGNMSESGLFIITNFPLDNSTQLRMLLNPEVDDMPLRGTVRWMCKTPHVGRSPGMGIQLMAPPEHYVDYVRELS